MGYFDTYQLIHMLRFLLITEKADMPQDFTAYLSKDNETEGCTLQLGWRSPSNIAQSDISCYSAFVDGENVASVTKDINQNLTLISYRVCDCGAHRVWVSAIDCCGREGQNTSIIELNQEPISLPMSDCGDVTTTQSGDFNNEQNGYRSKTQCMTTTCTIFCIS